MTSAAQLGALRARIECELPNANMHNFEGVLYVDGVASASASASASGLALTKDQVMLRGSSLQNTEFVFGICIGAGKQTKLFLNSNEPPYKRTQGIV